jgi:hypothetical protein
VKEMKVKIFYSFDMNALEIAINAFIEYKKVFDIKFTDLTKENRNFKPITTAFILYEDIENAPSGSISTPNNLMP